MPDVSREEYLSSNYKPDREYIDGNLVERNAGYGPHGHAQMAVGAALHREQNRLSASTLMSQRVQVAETRFRVPDLCVIRKEDFSRIIQRPPLLCVEILSPDDRWSGLQDSIDDYLRFGVAEIWVIDPKEAKFWLCTRDGGVRLMSDGVLRWNGLSIDLREILPE